jgi:hypothetical protein
VQQDKFHLLVKLKKVNEAKEKINKLLPIQTSFVSA